MITNGASRNKNFTARKDSDLHPYLPKLTSNLNEKENTIKINIESNSGQKIKEVKIV